MTNEIRSEDAGNKKIYNLGERTAVFGEEIVKFATRIPKNVITLPLITQLVKAGTSIGANYCEADGAESRKDFEHKIGIRKKESKETKYWLRIIKITIPESKHDAERLWQEAQELTLIFSSIRNSSQKRPGN